MLYVLVNAGYGMLKGISPLDIVRDCIPISSLVIFLIIKRFIKNSKDIVQLEKLEFFLILIFGVDFAIMTVTNSSTLYHYFHFQIDPSALQMLTLFYVSMVGFISFQPIAGIIPVLYRCFLVLFDQYG